MIENLTSFFKVYGDATRIKILFALMEQELCVGDIASILNLSSSAVSQQLRILRQAKLVKPRKAGKTVCYSLDDEHIRSILDIGFQHIGETL